MELAIDTSTRYAGVALSQDGEPVAELSWRSERNHTVELAPAVQRLLAQAGAKARDLRAVLVAKGPGGFSALRVGMALAKGMAVALEAPLVGVGTLEVEAYPYAGVGLPLCPLLEMGRGEVAWALYQEVDGEFRCLREPEVATVEAVVSAAGGLPTGAALCGEGLWGVLSQVRGLVAEPILCLVAPPPTRRAFSLARLGARRLAQGLADDPATLQPLYLRRPSITVGGRGMGG